MKLKYDDQHHSYWLDGRRCKSVTTVAKIPDDTYSLDQWRKRQVAIGMAISPPLVERAAAHYDDRDQLDRIAEEAMVAAKAHEAAGRGTAAHRITERIDLGQDIVDTPLARAVRAAWGRALDDAGLEIIPELVERIVLYESRFIAGRFDRICRRRSDGATVVVDLKTGDNAVRYPHSIAVQLALYANAPLLAGPIPNGGGATMVFENLPLDLDRTVGYVVHMPTEAQAEVVEIDIAAGWDIVNQAVFPILDWRARKNLVSQQVSAAVWAPSPRLVTEDGTVDLLQDPPPAAGPVPSTTRPTQQPVPVRAGTLLPGGDVAGAPGVADMVDMVDPRRVEWIRTWIRQISDIDQLAQLWPPDVPTPRNGEWRTWTNVDIDAIATACAAVDAANDAPLWPPDPSTPTPTSIQTRSK